MSATFYKVIASIAAFCMAAMVLVTLLDATGRYFFSAPLHGAIEYISYLLAFLTMSGYALVTRDRGHIAVGVFADLFRGGMARLERVVTALATLAATGFITWFLIGQGLSYQRNSRISDTMHIPLAWLVFALAILAGFAVLFAALLVWQALTGHERRAEGSHRS